MKRKHLLKREWLIRELFSVDICTLRETVGNEVRYIYSQKSREFYSSPN